VGHASQLERFSLSEPRFRIAVIFAIRRVLLQVGLSIINRALPTSAVNVVFTAALGRALSHTSSALHPPPSPIFSSGIPPFAIFFMALNLVVLFAAYQLVNKRALFLIICNLLEL
jgi:hypothetical protein